MLYKKVSIESFHQSSSLNKSTRDGELENSNTNTNNQNNSLENDDKSDNDDAEKPIKFQIIFDKDTKLQIGLQRSIYASIKLLDFYKKLRFTPFNFNFFREKTISPFVKCIFTLHWKKNSRIGALFQEAVLEFEKSFYLMNVEANKLNFYFSQKIDKSKIMKILDKFSIEANEPILIRYLHDSSWNIKINSEFIVCNSKKDIYEKLKSNPNYFEFYPNLIGPLFSLFKSKKIYLYHSIKDRNRILNLAINNLIFNSESTASPHFIIIFDYTNDVSYILILCLDDDNFPDFVSRFEKLFDTSIPGIFEKDIIKLTVSRNFLHKIKEKKIEISIDSIQKFSSIPTSLIPTLIKDNHWRRGKEHFKKKKSIPSPSSSIFKVITRHSRRNDEFNNLNGWMINFFNINQKEFDRILEKIFKYLCSNRNIMRIGSIYLALKNIQMIFVDYVGPDFNDSKFLGLFEDFNGKWQKIQYSRISLNEDHCTFLHSMLEISSDIISL